MNKNVYMALFVAVSLVLAGCASTYRGYGYSGVIIDEKGVDMEKFRSDLADCEAYADQVSKGERVAGEAAEGALVGGVIGAIFNGSRGAANSAARGAGAGGVLGGVKGAKSAEYEKKRVVRNCLVNRGYRVLN